MPPKKNKNRTVDDEDYDHLMDVLRYAMFDENGNWLRKTGLDRAIEKVNHAKV